MTSVKFQKKKKRMEGPLEKIKRYKEKNVAKLCKLQRSYDNNVHVDSQGFAVGLTLCV